MKIREIEIAVISDLHLATHASKAKKVLKYLKSIKPKILVLNGDIIDSWRFSRSFFPKSHLKVVRNIIKSMESGIQVIYITGNHDEFLRKFDQVKIGKLKLVNQLTLNIEGNRTWILHGDIFDDTIHHTKWLAKIGAASKGLLTIINKVINFPLRALGIKEIIIYKKIKRRLNKSKEELSKFEKKIADAAIQHKFDTVICGHTHIPRLKKLRTIKDEVNYINCGDWVESFTAAEFANGQWSLHQYKEIEDELLLDEPEIPNRKELYNSLYRELAMTDII